MLLQMPVNIVVPDKEQCTKVYAIQQVMERYSPEEYDMIIIFNSDNRIVPHALDLSITPIIQDVMLYKRTV